MPLTDTAIKKLKASDKPVKVSDERGLYPKTQAGSGLTAGKQPPQRIDRIHTLPQRPGQR